MKPRLGSRHLSLPRKHAKGLVSGLAGTWHFHGLLDMPAWIYQKISFYASGNLTITYELTSMGVSPDVPRSATALIGGGRREVSCTVC